MDRATFKRLAASRLTEAQILLRARQYSGAYYLAGYVVECGLKACIAKQTRRFEFPDGARVNDSYQHALTKLIRVAGLEVQQQADGMLDPAFDYNWAIAKDWSEASRYDVTRKAEAIALVSAVAEPHHGMMQWLARFW